MTINYITNDDGVYDQALVQNLITEDLETGNVRLLENGKSFTLTTISTSGYQPHNRNKGFNTGEYSNDKEVYTMQQDRDIEFYVDSMDVEETNEDLAVARISSTFQQEQAAPEIDAYRFSKFAKTAINEGNSAEEEITPANVYSRLKEAILPIRKYGPGNMIIYVSSEVMDALERSEEFSRSITNQDVGQTALESRVTSLDGVAIKEVWDFDRFHTDFDFSNGYEPTGNAINFLVVVRNAQISVVKHNAIFLFAPGQHTQGDGHLYQNRLYHDTFVPKQQLGSVYVSHKPTDAPAG